MVLQGPAVMLRLLQVQNEGELLYEPDRLRLGRQMV